MKRGKKLIVIFIAFLCMSANAVAEREKILIIQSYHPVLAWTAQCDKGIESVLGSKYEIYSFYMDTKRIPKSEFGKRADMAFELYSEINPVLVMIGDDNALRLLGPKLSKTRTPVVFFGINNNPRYYFDNNQLPKNMKGVLERTPIGPWLRYLHKIIPDAKKALILMDASPTSEAIAGVFFQGRKTVRMSDVTAEYKIAKDWSEWKTIVKNAGEYDMLLIPTFHAVKDETGANVNIENVVKWTSANTMIPVFSNQDYTVGAKGVIGAYVIHGEEHAKLAAEIALNLLESKKTPLQYNVVTDVEGKFFFNKFQLDRFKLKLPKEIRDQAVFQ